MELMTISQVSKRLHISTRTLRYYEQVGLIESQRRDGYAYRSYDDDALRRLQQIIILRKLRVPLRQIGDILQSGDAAKTASVFRENIAALSEQIVSLSVLRDILNVFVDKLNSNLHLNIEAGLLGDAAMVQLVETLSSSRISQREDLSMENLNKANESLGKLTDVRIITIAPSTVAAIQFEGPDPEYVTGLQMDKFVRDSKLWEIKPDARVFGFNCPNPTDESNAHGYEFWATIPDDMEVPAPLVKKHYPGGMYAAHMMQMGNFQEWAWIDQWVRTNDRFDYAGQGNPQNMFDSLEEQLNYFHILRKTPVGEMMQIEQLDLLIPVREKETD